MNEFYCLRFDDIFYNAMTLVGIESANVSFGVLVKSTRCGGDIGS